MKVVRMSIDWSRGISDEGYPIKPKHKSTIIKYTAELENGEIITNEYEKTV